MILTGKKFILLSSVQSTFYSILDVRSCRAPIMHLNQNRGQRNNVCLKYLYLYIYIFVINLDLQQLSVGLNITCVHLPAFIDFANVFIRYRSKQSISELSLIATEVVSTTDFFLERNYSYGTKTSINFVDVRSKPRICKLFEFYTIFFSCCTLNSLDSIICRCA